MKVGHYQASNKRNPLQQCNGFFAIWDLVNSQEPMPNSVVAALVHPVLHGICIPIHQKKQLEGEPHGRPSRQEGSEAFAM